MSVKAIVAAGVAGVVGIVASGFLYIVGFPGGISGSNAQTNCSSVAVVPPTVSLDATSYARVTANWPTYVSAGAAVTVDGQPRPVPPEVLAAIHYREADNDPTLDLQTGSQITATTPTLDQSAIAAGVALQEAAFKYTAHWIDASNPDVVTLGEAFYSYDNRNPFYAAIANQRGFPTQPWRGDPFVVNQYDAQSQSMVALDPVTGQPGAIVSTPGALTVETNLHAAAANDELQSSSTAASASIPQAYATIFTTAAQAEGTNPEDLAAIFVTEHGNNWPNPSGPWATSKSAGAVGPFQFLTTTWPEYATDGDGDGKADISNLADAAFSAAKLLRSMGVTPTVALGTIEHPWTGGTFLYAAGAYNAGGGTLQVNTKPGDPLAAPGLNQLSDNGRQVENYVANVYYLVTTNFVHGNPGYGNAAGTVIDNSGSSKISINTPQTCNQNGPVSDVADVTVTSQYGDAIAKLAISLAWDDYSHGLTPKPGAGGQPGYTDLLNKYDNGGAPGIGVSDCGSFVTTLMRATGADPDYPSYGTSNQQSYLHTHLTTPTARSHVHYQQIANTGNTAQMMQAIKPGDIFVVNKGNGVADGHTYVYVGPQANGRNIAEASAYSDAPYLNVVQFNDSLHRGLYSIYRVVQ